MPTLNPVKYIRFLNKVHKYSRRIKHLTDLSFLDQLKEVYGLLKLNSIEPKEYYEVYQLWSSHYNWEDKKSFLSRNQFARMNINLDPPSQNGLFNKHVFNTYARSMDLPVAYDFGLFHPFSGYTADGKELRTLNQLEKFFEELEVESVMIKPTSAGHGHGIMLCEKLGNGEFLLNHTEKITINDLYARMCNSIYTENQCIHDSYLIQEVLKQHPFFDQYGTSCTQTVRIVTYARLSGEIDILAILFKMGISGAHIDNIGMTGLAARVDENGIISHASQEIDGILKRCDRHPKTNAPIKDQKIPLLEEAVKLAKRAQRLVPQIRTVGWDVAITDNDKAVIIEGNTYWGWESIQHGSNYGFLKGEFAKEVYHLMGK